MSSGRGASKHNRSFVNGSLLLTEMRVTLVYLNLSPLSSIYQSVSPRTTCIVAWRWNRLTKRRNAAWPTVHEDHITCHQVLVNQRALNEREFDVCVCFGDANTRAATEIGFHSSVSFHSLFELSAPSSKVDTPLERSVGKLSVASSLFFSTKRNQMSSSTLWLQGHRFRTKLLSLLYTYHT